VTRNAALLVAALVVAVAIAESVLGLWQPRAIATEADWDAAADHVRRALHADDLIVFAPSWIDPIGRQHLGDKMPIEMVARADDDRYARIWELSVHGARSEDTAGLTAAETQRFGRVTVRRYDRRAVQILRDLTDDFAHADVSQRARADAPIVPCAHTGKDFGFAQAWRCENAQVEPRVLEVDYQPRWGILVPVLGDGAILFDYGEVPAGHLVGYVGLHDYYARKNGSGKTLFELKADDNQSVKVPLQPPLREGNDWHRFEIDLMPGASHHLRISVTGEHANRMFVGFHVEVRAP
jgi:hypothetical protein